MSRCMKEVYRRSVSHSTEKLNRKETVYIFSLRSSGSLLDLFNRIYHLNL